VKKWNDHSAANSKLFYFILLKGLDCKREIFKKKTAEHSEHFEVVSSFKIKKKEIIFSFRTLFWKLLNS
jgi:hypothetical protein